MKSNYQHFAQKIRSIRPLNQDNYVNVKTTNTPPKTVGPKSTHELDNKSPRLSVDDISQPKKPFNPKKSTKEQAFENKIKIFMERNEVDRELEEKVKKRLIEISTNACIQEQELVMGSREWL